MGFLFLFLFFLIRVSFELLLNFKCYYLLVSFDLIYRIILVQLATLINPFLRSPLRDLNQLGHNLKSHHPKHLLQLFEMEIFNGNAAYESLVLVPSMFNA